MIGIFYPIKLITALTCSWMFDANTSYTTWLKWMFRFKNCVHIPSFFFASWFRTFNGKRSHSTELSNPHFLLLKVSHRFDFVQIYVCKLLSCIFISKTRIYVFVHSKQVVTLHYSALFDKLTLADKMQRIFLRKKLNIYNNLKITLFNSLPLHTKCGTFNYCNVSSIEWVIAWSTLVTLQCHCIWRWKPI